MPKKRFEETPYDPIAADLAREVAANGRAAPTAPLQDASRLPRGITALEGRFAGDPVPPNGSVQPPTSAEPTITKRFILSRSEDDELNAFLLRLQQQAGTKVTVSVLARAAMHLVMRAEQEIIHEIGTNILRKLPSTHDSLALGEFEEQWLVCLANALRRLPRSGLMQSSSRTQAPSSSPYILAHIK